MDLDWVWIGQYGSIPLVAAIVGWGTNAVAISMTFYPLEFRGCFPNFTVYGMPICGWQGIIPANCRRMATQAVELMTSKLFNPNEAASKLNTERLAKEMRPALEALTPRIVDEIAQEYAPQKWELLPESVKREIKSKCLEKSTNAISQMMVGSPASSPEEAPVMDGNLTEMMAELLIDLLVKDKQLVNDIFLQCAGSEYKFIRVSGFYLGFLFGLGQMYLWTKFQQWWVLPLAGFLVGYLTNFVALKCIFTPIEPYHVLGFTIHGLFLKRQKEVADVYARLFSTKVLNSENLIVGMINSPKSDALFALVDEHVKQAIDDFAKKVVLSKRLAKVLVGRGRYDGVKESISKVLRDRENIMSFIPYATPYLDETLNVRNTLESSMANLSYQEFADMLLPAFSEGELKLIIIGGILGAIVGMLQALVQVPHQLGL
jgi:uncharacterized membrane protein YheB (UPF0754 family)